MCWPTRKPPPDVERLVFGQPAASASDRPSIVTRSVSFCSGNSDTARGVWSIVRYASDGSSRRVLLSRLRDCTPCLRMQCVVGLLPDTPVLLTCCDRLFCPSGSSSSWSSGALGLAPPGLACGRAAWSPSSATAQLCVSRVSFPRQSRVAVRHTAVQHARLTVAASSQSGFLYQLLVQLLCQHIEVVTTSSDDEIAPMHDKIQIS